eukprot:UN02096
MVKHTLAEAENALDRKVKSTANKAKNVELTLGAAAGDAKSTMRQIQKDKNKLIAVAQGTGSKAKAAKEKLSKLNDLKFVKNEEVLAKLAKGKGAEAAKAKDALEKLQMLAALAAGTGAKAIEAKNKLNNYDITKMKDIQDPATVSPMEITTTIDIDDDDLYHEDEKRCCLCACLCCVGGTFMKGIKTIYKSFRDLPMTLLIGFILILVGLATTDATLGSISDRLEQIDVDMDRVTTYVSYLVTLAVLTNFSTLLIAFLTNEAFDTWIAESCCECCLKCVSGGLCVLAFYIGFLFNILLHWATTVVLFVVGLFVF